MQKEKTEKANLLAKSAQLQMLQYQMNPHFLFNAFSSLRALIREDQSKAEEMISGISKFMRYSLASENNVEVSLKREISVARHYIDIEKIRFGDKLQTRFEIDLLAKEYPVPSFIIHPILEDAIKYGMNTSSVPLKIELKAEVINNDLRIEVTSTGSWIENSNTQSKSGTESGLENVKKRLQHIYPKNHHFSIEKLNGKVKVTLEIKKELEKQGE